MLRGAGSDALAPSQPGEVGGKQVCAGICAGVSHCWHIPVPSPLAWGAGWHCPLGLAPTSLDSLALSRVLTPGAALPSCRLRALRAGAQQLFASYNQFPFEMF